VETRGWKNGVAKSVATTNLINALADFHKVPLYETPVGFKYIGALIDEDKIAIGGEESAGLTIRGHVPEKDGVISRDCWWRRWWLRGARAWDYS
jgi:phosphoglucomutase